jgi:Asp/Glu/hydantoin racemase
MRIWYQSSIPLGVDQAFSAYEQSLRRHCKEVARPDTLVDIRGTEVLSEKTESSRYIESLHVSHILKNAIRAEREGYDVFAMGCMLDPGFLEVREVIGIPVVFGAEVCFHLACVLAQKFALLGYNGAVLRRVSQQVEAYGLERWLIPAVSFDISLIELQNGFERPEHIISEVGSIAKKAAGEGAGTLLSTCNCLNMILIDNRVREIEGLMIMDNVGVIVKAAEFMADLSKIGVGRSKKGAYAPLSKQDLASIRKLYRLD